MDMIESRDQMSPVHLAAAGLSTTAEEEDYPTAELVIAHIREAFAENRSFPFVPDASIVAQWHEETQHQAVQARLVDLKNSLIAAAANGDQTVAQRLASDTHLSSRLMQAIAFIHQALADIKHDDLLRRRFALIQEKPGCPAICQIANTAPVISHIGSGPTWAAESPTMYLGLRVFDVLAAESRKGQGDLYEAFKRLLLVEERAIETGYSHIEALASDTASQLQRLVEAVVCMATVPASRADASAEKGRLRPLTQRRRQALLAMLNARLPEDEQAFDVAQNLHAVKSLERLARQYKKGDDRQSLREIVRLLVAASGHDLHDVRNHANVTLERVLAPKPFEAPLASTFVNLRLGQTHRFAFALPRGKSRYGVRLYRHGSLAVLPLERELQAIDLELHDDPSEGCFTAEYRFTELGHYDFLVYRQKGGHRQWLPWTGCSGRLNVIPDVRGDIVLEIFPDIHGHTRVYWRDETGHPGLVYNENSEIIRLGQFADITAHLHDLKQRYRITALYLLGVQRRGSNREDWAPEATSPSPFAPMSLTEIEPALGGEAAFRHLIEQAHALDIKVIVDVIPHLNRKSLELPDTCAVTCYDAQGGLVVRASTDGRYGSWNDGKLLNYRKLEVWEWLADAVSTLIERYDIDGVRFDSCHAMPIMMQRHNAPTAPGGRRTDEEMVEGTIIVNDRIDDHFVTTGYYDSACSDTIASPFHSYIMRAIERALHKKGRPYFITLAECYWGRERLLARSGIIPYNSALFKICEHITHGQADVRDIYHLYDTYFPSVLPPGTELLGILGNHDERRALNTFGQRGLRAAVALTNFMSNLLMDYEGSAEGESWKVYPDNIHVDWQRFEYASHRSLEPFYREQYDWHRRYPGRSYLIWTNNPKVAAAMRFSEAGHWIGVFNFGDGTERVALQFDHPALPIQDDAVYRLIDHVYSPLTGQTTWYTGRELRHARLQTTVSYTDRVKLFRVECFDHPGVHYRDVLRESFARLWALRDPSHFAHHFAFREIAAHASSLDRLSAFLSEHLLPLCHGQDYHLVELGCKRLLYHLVREGYLAAETVGKLLCHFTQHPSGRLRELGRNLQAHMQRGPLVFIAAEAEPFSKWGGLANVLYELPRELVKQGEEVYVITPLYQHGDAKAVGKMRDALQRYEIAYTGTNVRFKIEDIEYEVGVHFGTVAGVGVFLLDHHEFFDGLYWGFTAEERLRRRLALARACAELIVVFGLRPMATFTNDAYAGLFNGIVRSDPVYANNPNFQRTSFFHIIHNGGWEYFDSYDRYERGFDHFRLFNLPGDKVWAFSDPVSPTRLNCMAAGARFADRVITVSPAYAEQLKVAGDGLERVLTNVTGINNGVGRDFHARMQKRLEQSAFVATWYPRLLQRLETDDVLCQKMETRYPELLMGASACASIQDKHRRAQILRLRNKLLLQLERGLAVDPDRILFTMVHRLVDQKGFQLLLEASEGIFKTLGYQGVIGGPVNAFDRRSEELAHGLRALQSYYPEQVSVTIGLQDVSLPLLASDVFLMPSLYEPGGIAQLEALACGCLVVARATGGLRDTIRPLTVRGRSLSGNGFLFTDPTPAAFYDAMQRCAHFFQHTEASRVQRVRQCAQRSVLFWDDATRRYIDEIYATKEIVRPCLDSPVDVKAVQQRHTTLVAKI